MGARNTDIRPRWKPRDLIDSLHEYITILLFEIINSRILNLCLSKNVVQGYNETNTRKD